MPRLLQILRKHVSEIRSCDFYANYLATCSSDKTVRLWTWEDHSLLEEVPHSPFLGHKYGVNCVRFAPSGKELASCSTDGTVIVWCVQNGNKVRQLQHSRDSAVRVCVFNPTIDLIASGGDSEKVLLWSRGLAIPDRILDSHDAMITALDFSPDGWYLISCSSAGDIILWDARYGHGKCLASTTDAHDLGTLGCEFRPTVKITNENWNAFESCYALATCGNDDNVKLWYITADKAHHRIVLHTTLKGHTSSVFACRFSKDGMLLASAGADRIVILWNPDTGSALQNFQFHTRFVTCCAFSNSSLIASGSNDNSIAIVELESSDLSNNISQNILSAATGDSSAVTNLELQNVSSWSVNNVVDWLKSINLAHCCEAFEKHAIDGKTLLYLTDEELRILLCVGALGERYKILQGIQALKNPLWKPATSDFEDIAALKEFICPITHDVMMDPVVAADGYSYENSAIKEWFANGNMTSPMTNEVLENKLLIPNRVLQSLIKKFHM